MPNALRVSIFAAVRVSVDFQGLRGQCGVQISTLLLPRRCAVHRIAPSQCAPQRAIREWDGRLACCPHQNHALQFSMNLRAFPAGPTKKAVFGCNAHRRILFPTASPTLNSYLMKWCACQFTNERSSSALLSCPSTFFAADPGPDSWQQQQCGFANDSALTEHLHRMHHACTKLVEPKHVPR